MLTNYVQFIKMSQLPLQQLQASTGDIINCEANGVFIASSGFDTWLDNDGMRFGIAMNTSNEDKDSSDYEVIHIGIDHEIADIIKNEWVDGDNTLYDPSEDLARLSASGTDASDISDISVLDYKTGPGLGAFHADDGPRIECLFISKGT